MPKIKIKKDIYQKLKMAAQTAGYSSVDEFAIHVLEKEVASLDEGDSEEETRKKLQGLGYIS